MTNSSRIEIGGPNGKVRKQLPWQGVSWVSSVCISNMRPCTSPSPDVSNMSPLRSNTSLPVHYRCVLPATYTMQARFCHLVICCTYRAHGLQSTHQPEKTVMRIFLTPRHLGVPFSLQNMTGPSQGMQPHIDHCLYSCVHILDYDLETCSMIRHSTDWPWSTVLVAFWKIGQMMRRYRLVEKYREFWRL